jgi:hypothetical protein
MCACSLYNENHATTAWFLLYKKESELMGNHIENERYCYTTIYQSFAACYNDYLYLEIGGEKIVSSVFRHKDGAYSET